MHVRFMITPVQIRNLSPEALKKLKERAAAESQSLSSYLRVELEKLASRPTMKDWVEQVRSRPPVNISSAEIVAAIRETRQEREDHIDQVLKNTVARRKTR